MVLERDCHDYIAVLDMLCSGSYSVDDKCK